MQVIDRTLLFSLLALFVSVLVDIALAFVGSDPFSNRAEWRSHAGLHGAVLACAAIAALPCFLLLKHRLPSRLATINLGVACGLLAPPFAIAAMMITGSYLGAAAGFAVAVLLAGGGSMVFGRKRGDGA